ncbi:glutamate-5-semialdehyde dehydrogenase [Geitlerinema sp. PCC 9228]|jgi:glutamate-5-semialdehyde dehydrogenase|uniref:glutamate-5-semialdehyde dehydrogenase n=1 Tax=Geitlerinema sp. PCC 9228 TaxID=111611 RepID=UPI0008F9A91F|nr:glutamate-5-semialdehyde dehydrogenase [Geitlerinema sp. PCC 9228]
MSNQSLDLSADPATAARRAYEASLVLAKTKAAVRSEALTAMAEALKESQDDILEANTLDLEASRDMAMSELMLDWIKLTPERLQSSIQIVERLAELSDPTRRLLNASYQLEQSQTYCQLVPLGAIALIYEAFPEIAAIAAGMCLRTGNSIILKGGSDSSNANTVIAEAIKSAVEQSGLPTGSIEFLAAEQGSTIRDLLTQDRYINLVIPYGRPSLIQQVMRQATTSVLKSAMGNCYLYWSGNGSLELVRWAILDSHKSVPDPVNAIEKVLIHTSHNSAALTSLWKSLQDNRVQIRGDERIVAEYPQVPLCNEAEWSQPYFTRTVAFKMVDSLDEAIAWINQRSSGHADCIVTESYQESCQFGVGVNSASVYVNMSPRFSRLPKQRDTVFLGMSNQKGYRRGLINLEALTTVKQVIQGSGYL